MAEIRTMLAEFKDICSSPAAMLKKTVENGRKAVGVMPYFCPEELVYAAGMLPVGLWGAELQASESRRYFPPFFCGILHTVLEMGLRGELKELSAIMVPACCDSLKGMSANWEYGVPEVPVISVSFAENRKLPAGIEYTAQQFTKILHRLEEIAGRKISDDDIRSAIGIYNENRRALREFTEAASEHPELISAEDRCSVIKAGYFIDRAEHTKLLTELTEELKKTPVSDWKGLRVVTTGIIADSPALLRLFDENKISIAEDWIAHESVFFRYPVPDTENPIYGLAERIAQTEGCSVLYDPGKLRSKMLIETAKNKQADGIIWIMTKFCDPEEFDYVIVRKEAEKAGIPLLVIDTDMQMTDYAQARSALEAFGEQLEARRL